MHMHAFSCWIQAVELGERGVRVNASLLRVEAHRAKQWGVLAANGALACDTGARTGRSPGDKFLEDTPAIHDSIDWGSTRHLARK